MNFTLWIHHTGSGTLVSKVIAIPLFFKVNFLPVDPLSAIVVKATWPPQQTKKLVFDSFQADEVLKLLNSVQKKERNAEEKSSIAVQRKKQFDCSRLTITGFFTFLVSTTVVINVLSVSVSCCLKLTLSFIYVG